MGREHVEAVEFFGWVKAWFAGIGNVVHVLLFPPLLPPGFNVLGECRCNGTRSIDSHVCLRPWGKNPKHPA